MSCGVGRPRCGSDVVLLWLWYMTAAVALIHRLAWEPPYAVGAALKRPKKKKKFGKRYKGGLLGGGGTVVKYSQHPLSKTHRIPVPLTMAPTLGRTVWCLLELMWGQLSSGSHPMLSVGDQEGVMGQGLRAVK